VGWRLVPASLPLLGGGVSGVYMAGPEAVCESVAASIAGQDLTGSSVLVSAGPTCEDIDPVRFLTNRSSGLMGVALALAAWRRGAAVTLVHGPLQVDIPCLPGLQALPVRSAVEMQAAVLACSASQTVAILCAAVADFRPAQCAERKIKKNAGQGRVLELVPTPDILAALGALPRRPFLVGFAAETHDLHAHAADKLRRKNCDLLCANDVTEPGSGFGVSTNRLTLFARDGSVVALPQLSKVAAAERVLDRVVAEIRLPAPRLNP
jgi:phosphopantothenoylcysteine decarboxylase/phosphopantothenate--cysteine ligase